ncbi:MAG: ABC transporter ATP-binding protein [Candidatus Zixiibacteriota bacterium]|nr:MAG: ABC transporter ATP-binding protein [candidate division Zixibacteria bacterium]
MIRLENLIKDFARVRAVDSLNLHVRRGEIFGFLGPNGAGKSTTIRLITGLLQPTYGRVVVGGFDLAEKPRHVKRLIGYVPDQPFLYERLSGREFVEFRAQLYMISRDACRASLGRLAEAFEMDGLLDEHIETYSQGARQKTAILAALVHDPELIILDEPLVGLDPRAARVFKDLLRARVRAGATVFFSTHLLPIAQELCDRLAIIDRGRLVALGAYGELSLLGEANLEAAYLRITQTPAQAG